MAMEELINDLDLEEGYPAFDGDIADIVKKAAFVTAGSVAGAYVGKGIAQLTANTYVVSGVEAALGIAVAIFAGRQAIEPLTWGGIGVTAHGLGSLLAALIPTGA